MVRTARWIVYASVAMFLATSAYPQTQRVNEDCDNEVHLGLNTMGGNRTSLGGNAGTKTCRDDQKRRWALEGNVAVVRIEQAAGATTVQQHKVEGSHELTFHEQWSAVLDVTQEGDTGGGLESRWIVAPGIGREFTPNWGFTSVEVGVTRTWENNRGRPRESFPEGWMEIDLQWPIRRTVKFREQLDMHVSTEDRDDYRYDSSTSMAFRIGEHFSLRLAFALRWDNRPAPGYGKTDWRTNMFFVYAWGKGTPQSAR